MNEEAAGCDVLFEMWSLVASKPHPWEQWHMDKLAMLSEILAANPADSFARYGLAMEHLGHGDTDAALSEFETTTQHNANYVPAYQMSGQTLAKLHRNDEAKARLQAGLGAAERTGNQHAASEMQALLDELESGY